MIVVKAGQALVPGDRWVWPDDLPCPSVGHRIVDEDGYMWTVAQITWHPHEEDPQRRCRIVVQEALPR